MGFPGGSVVKNPPAMQKMQARFLGQEDPLEKGNGNSLQSSCLGNTYGQRSLLGYSPWITEESDMT